MKPLVLKGSKQEIAEQVAQLEGDVREAIVFIAEPSDDAPVGASDSDDMWAEMRPYMVEVGDFDDSREAIYTRQEGD